MYSKTDKTRSWIRRMPEAMVQMILKRKPQFLPTMYLLNQGLRLGSELVSMNRLLFQFWNPTKAKKRKESYFVGDFARFASEISLL